MSDLSYPRWGQELIDSIKRTIQSIENSKVYYTLKKMKVKRVTEQQILATKIFLALHWNGIPIVNTHLFLEFYGKTRAAVLALLHELGDKGVLTLVQNRKSGPLRYVLSTKFTEHYNDNIGTEKVK